MDPNCYGGGGTRYWDQPVVWQNKMQNPGEFLVFTGGLVEYRMGSVQDVHFEFHDEQDEY